MAATTNAHIRNIKDHLLHVHKDASNKHRSVQGLEKNAKKANISGSMKENLRIEKYCKYWSILSNVAAIVSVSGAVLAMMKKRRFW